MVRRFWRTVSAQPAIRPFTEWRIWLQWRAAGRPVPPPPFVKQRLLRQCAARYGLRTFVETGTFAGETTAALAASVERIISIELDPPLAEAARVRFAAAPHITILEGNSGELLRRAIASLTDPALFWLDGHYSGSITARGAQDSPITDEIEAILAHPARGHVVLIDDARHLNGCDGYPTIDALRERILSRAPGSRLDVADDIITWIGPGSASA
ncbi:MAG TPA: hypothetical protein VHJ77_20280 [Vicinamibacterales bacterium]|jgi:hypothetical protein|nr:hypothetical protein [Vicinamibacterales bacterium]